MNKQRGNMYSWVSHTWNPVKGKCPHDCNYCYMKRFPQKEMREAYESSDEGGTTHTYLGGRIAGLEHLKEELVK